MPAPSRHPGPPMTGCRFGEIAALEWDWIKDKRIHLPDSKSGPRTVWLLSDARAVIDSIPRYGPDCPYLFPAHPPARPIDNIASQWNRIRDEAGLPGLRRPSPLLGIHRRREQRGHGDHRKAARPCAGRGHRALRPSVRPVRCRRRRPGVEPHPGGPGRKGGRGQAGDRRRAVRPGSDTRPGPGEVSAMSTFDLTPRPAPNPQKAQQQQEDRFKGILAA